jgi:hypothetical protein
MMSIEFSGQLVLPAIGALMLPVSDTFRSLVWIWNAGFWPALVYVPVRGVHAHELQTHQVHRRRGQRSRRLQRGRGQRRADVQVVRRHPRPVDHQAQAQHGGVDVVTRHDFAHLRVAVAEDVDVAAAAQACP